MEKNNRICKHYYTKLDFLPMNVLLGVNRHRNNGN